MVLVPHGHLPATLGCTFARREDLRHERLIVAEHSSGEMAQRHDARTVSVAASTIAVGWYRRT